MESKLETLNVRVLNESAERVVVLGHGFGLDQSVWRYIVAGLAGSGFKVVLFDWPFSGAVDPKHFCTKHHRNFFGYAYDLLAILEELQIEKCSFVGHSMSGMVGCLASIERPQIFEKLILLCASPRYLRDESFNGGFSRAEIDGLYSAMKSDFSGWASLFAPLAVGVKDHAAIMEFTSKMIKMNPEIALETGKMIFESDFRNLLSDVKTSCFVIQTTKDVAVPLNVASYLKENLGGMTTLEILECEGHLPQLTSPSSLLRSLQNALEERDESFATVCKGQTIVAVET